MRHVNFASEEAGGGGDEAREALAPNGAAEGRTSSTILILGRRCRNPGLGKADPWPGTNEYELLYGL